MSDGVMDRLFVPLATEPYRWFESGLKTWELRALRRQFNLKTVRVGRAVELRRGYSKGESLWGTVRMVRTSKSISSLLHEAYYKNVIPVAESEEEAIEIAAGIIGQHGMYIAFQVTPPNPATQ